MSQATRPRLAALVLAAGNSTRLGQDKTQLTLHGTPLLSRAIALADSVAEQVYAVVRPEFVGAVGHGGGEGGGEGTTWLVNPDPNRGMGSSIATGMAAVGDAEGVLILLVDQYRIDRSQLTELRSRWHQQPDAIVTCHYADTLGPPVIFPLRCFAKLVALDAGGAKHLLADDNLVRLDVPQAAYDLDTPADVLAFRAFETSAD